MSTLYRLDRFASPLTTARILDVGAGPQINAVGSFVIKVPDNVPIQKPTDYADLLTQRSLGYLLTFSSFPRVMFDDLLDASAVDMANSTGIMLGNPGEAVLFPGGILQSQTVSLGLAVLEGTFNVTNGSNIVPTTVSQVGVVVGSVIFASQPSVEYTVFAVNPTYIQLNATYTGTTDAKSLAYSVPASAPTQTLVTWDTFTNSNSDSKSGQYGRQYTEEPNVPGLITCELSFNNGVTWGTAYDGTVYDVPSVGQGTSFKIRLTNASANRLSIGSWSLLY